VTKNLALCEGWFVNANELGLGTDLNPGSTSYAQVKRIVIAVGVAVQEKTDSLLWPQIKSMKI